ncbi:MAG TPA: PAS domain S-box protein [Nannocystaceae bacterium]|nr:PAS domain S-box protein [Nannocystaceae bacterium]
MHPQSVDAFADALIVVDLDGVVSSWNRGAEHMFGWLRAEAHGRRIVELVVPEPDRDTELSRFRDAAQRGETTYESIHRHKDGSLVHVDVSLRLIRDDRGNPEGLAISTKDVSHLKYLREAGALEARFRGLLDAAPDAMLLVNRDGRIVMMNREAERLFGYSREQLIGQLIEVLVPNRFRATHPGRRREYDDDPRTRPMGANLDLSARRRDGSEFPAEISLSRVQLAEGTFTTVAIRDVGMRRRVEAKFRGLLEAAPDAIVIVDTSGNIVLVNAQAERMFGYERAELVGASVDILVPMRHRERHGGHRVGYVANPRARAMGSDLDLHAVRKDGTTFPVEISLSPLETEDGTLISSAIRDVTLRKETEHALKLAYKELESFSYSIAHDLRAPLRGMNGFAQVLLEDYADRLDDEGRDCLREIHDNALRMGALIDALLSLSRLSRSELRCEPVDLAAYARAALGRLASVEPGRKVELAAPPELPAWADPALARTLVENLVGNAWKFSARRPDARIEIGAAATDGRPAFFVRDNGVGFDMAHASKLFAPFQRLHRESDFAGTGIGLATAQRIVQRHGGRIWAEGRPDAGAAFFFTLPEATAK